jgi:hypothetical protein
MAFGRGLRIYDVVLLLASAGLLAGQPGGGLKGVILDQSGALVPGTSIAITHEGMRQETTSDDHGGYSFRGLAPGTYAVQAASPGLSQEQGAMVSIDTAVVTLNIRMRVVVERQEITVNETVAPQLSVDPAQTASTEVMRDSDLEALADDADDLAADLQALAGPAAGPNGGQVFIDGFTAGDGTLPNKNAIREIRINQNPFSPEFDTLGTGHIEILTKPGTDHLRGEVFFTYGNGIFNSRNPYAEDKAPFDLKDFGGSLSGHFTSRGSFFFDVDQRNIDNGAVINAITLDPATLAIVSPFTEVYVTPLSRLHIGTRADYTVNSKTTATLFYGLTKTDATDAGVGNFQLPEGGYNTDLVEHAVRASLAVVINDTMVNETRFQYLHQDSQQTPDSNAPTITVANAFYGGGASMGLHDYIHHHLEGQNLSTKTSGTHVLKFGGRVKATDEKDVSKQNFNGNYTFGGAYAPILNANDQEVAPGVVCNAAVSTAGCETISSIEQYRRTWVFQAMGMTPAQVRALGGGATQFSINTGNPVVYPGSWDIGLFAGDDWKATSNLTLSYGLRFETQAYISDRADFAPRLAFAWAPHGSSSKGTPGFVIRGGYGFFYDRFSEPFRLTAQRYNGINQQQFVLTNPDTFSSTDLSAIPSQAMLLASSSSQIIHTYSSSMRAPALMQSIIGVERQLPGKTTLAVNYTNSHGTHQFLTRNINAPLPGTYTGVAGSGKFPFPTEGPIYEMESAGLYNQNQLSVNLNARPTAKISLFATYTLAYAFSNTDGINTFPANQYDLAAEYGPAATDVRHRASLGGSITTKFGLLWSPFVILQSGMPFNIVTSQDIYGDTVLTARPGFAASGTPGVIATSYGFLDPTAAEGEKLVPRNYGRGPGLYSVNLRLARTFRFGEVRQGATSGRYALTLSISARNLLNHVNPGTIIGNINSPLFGQSNQIAGGSGAYSDGANNRRIELQARFSF